MASCRDEIPRSWSRSLAYRKQEKADSKPLSDAVAMRNLDDAGAQRELLDQRIGRRAVAWIQVGVPFVEQIDRRVGIGHDFPQRAQLPLAGGEAEMLGSVARSGRLAVAVVLRLHPLRELERQPVGRRPVVGPRLDL